MVSINRELFGDDIVKAMQWTCNSTRFAITIQRLAAG